MAWTSIVEAGDTVQTQHGQGKVVRVSENGGAARVDINGQLYEVQAGDMTKVEGVDKAPQEYQVGDWVKVPSYSATQIREITGKIGAHHYNTAEVNPETGELGTIYDSARAARELVPADKQRKDIKKEEGAPDEVKEEATPVRPYTVHKGQRVQHKDTGNKGKVTDVTQRAVKVQYDNGAKANYPKRDIGSYLVEEQKEQPKQEDKEPTPETQTPEQKKDTITATGDGLQELMRLKEYMENKIDTTVDRELRELKDLAKKNQKLEVKVEDRVNVVEGLKHKQLEQLINYCALRLSPLMVGMAGTGKTHAGEQTAKALGLDFYSMSVGAQTSKSDIIGYMSASGQYVSTHFRKAYEEGGVFLMDEIDAGNANVLIQINAALSNGLCAFPDKMVERHADFVFIASANTFGNGANRQYVGRNQLDAATLDRFAVIEWFIDDELEESLAVGLNGKAWYMAVRGAREYVAEKNIRALVSPRATQKGSRLLNVGQDLKEVIHATMLGSVPEDKKADVEEVATKIFNKFASEVPGQLPAVVVGDLIQ